MFWLDEEAVRRLLRWEDLLPAMERALSDFSGGRVLQPVRTALHLKERRAFFGLMPAADEGVVGAKLVTVYPENGSRGLPTHMGVIQLFRAETGEPLAAIDGRLITEMRTAAVSAVATRVLSAPDARVLAILGSGVQARAHLRALSLVRRFDEVRVWSRNAEHARSFAAETGAIASDAEQAVRGADVVVTVTHAAEPVLRGEWLKEGAHVNAVGAVGPKRRELDDEAMSGFVVVDSREAAIQESGDVLLAGAAIDAELGELLSGAASMRPAHHSVFKSLGIAVEDIAAARLVLERYNPQR
ncbi:MAG TPA: ornithine cyclodeaminase family protein [Bryobacteraceae bacterium]|jgi:thiomorpholine-carboxylate dehydrogenase|nr:ornithine cyclodeaminase family protein [Bryobacteraceae bacterium]